MQNEVTKETEGSATGEAPVVESNKQEQPAASQAPVTTGEAPAATPSQAVEPSTESSTEPTVETPSQTPVE